MFFNDVPDELIKVASNGGQENLILDVLLKHMKRVDKQNSIRNVNYSQTGIYATYVR